MSTVHTGLPSPTVCMQAQYDDPDGVLLPSSLVAGETVVWKRPTDPDIARTEVGLPSIVV